MLPGRTPLRVKLITAVLALVAIALAVISIAGISVLKTDLLRQSDSTLSVYVQRVQQDLGHGLPASPQFQLGEAATWVPDTGRPQAIFIPTSAAGFGAGAAQQAMPGPEIPSSLASIPSDPQHAVTVAASSGDGRWRMVGLAATAVSPDGSSERGVIIVATDVTSVYHTIAALAGIDILVSMVIVLGLAVVGIAVVRASLRPLTDIEQTAEAIAAGDLTRRVPDRDPRTEIGRLGRSLNAMLAQIEAAFGARAASEFAARRSEERMRQFVADASHELRTPLTAIRGFAEYYRQRGGLDLTPTGPPGGGNGSLPPADLDRIMRRVEQESVRMGMLVEDMLLLARLDQQRPLDHRPVDLLTLAADAVHDARVVAPERSINLIVSSGTALLVMGDEVRLRQVIGNLMSNALVHTPDGTPIEVRLRSGSFDEAAQPGSGHVAPGPPPSAAAVLSTAAARPTAAPPTAAPPTAAAAAPPPAAAGPPAVSLAPGPIAAVLEVADRGPGLIPAQAERAFERFYRADQARTAGGTGLGLAIVAALVAAHGGRVWVESPPGGGAIFRIALPLAPEALGPHADQEHDQPEPEQEHDQPEPEQEIRDQGRR
jgi:two-component system, OmpR family, sensor kinase